MADENGPAHEAWDWLAESAWRQGACALIFARDVAADLVFEAATGPLATVAVPGDRWQR